MKYRKLFKIAIQHQQDNSLIAIAVFSGLAAGAALSILFSPRSGRETRERIASLFSDKRCSVKTEAKDLVIEDLREITRTHAASLEGPSDKKKDPTIIKVPSAGTSAWKRQAAEHP